MRSIVLILFILSSSAYGQRQKRTNNNIDETIRIGDSLEICYANEDLFKSITDTLPIYNLDDNVSWKDIWKYMRLVKYFYNNSNGIKKISFRNGQEGNCYFYFEETHQGTFLRKVRVYKNGGFMNLQYYFTSEDNWFTLSEIDQRIISNPERKELYELLKTGKTFLDKFKTLL